MATVGCPHTREVHMPTVVDLLLRARLQGVDAAPSDADYARLVCCSCGLDTPSKFQRRLSQSSVGTAALTNSHKRARRMTSLSFLETMEHHLMSDHSHTLFVRTVEPHELFCAKCCDFVYDRRFDDCKAQFNELCQTSQPAAVQNKQKFTQVVCGIVNMGSTCFLSAALQCVFALPSLYIFFRLNNQRLLSCKKKSACMKRLASDGKNLSAGCIACELRILFHDLLQKTPRQSRDQVLSYCVHRGPPLIPSNLLYSIWAYADYMAGYEQQDSHECLIALLDGLSEHLETYHNPATKPRSPLKNSHSHLGHKIEGVVSETFTGVSCSTLTCTECSRKSKCLEPFRDLSVPISLSTGSTVDIKECLKEYVAPETLCAKCEKCGRDTEQMKCMQIAHPPNVLVIHLKRFDFQRSQKITTKVAFPLYGLQLDPYMESPESDLYDGKEVDTYDNQDVLYDLHGVVVHIGSLSMNQGHYIAYVRGEVLHPQRMDESASANDLAMGFQPHEEFLETDIDKSPEMTSNESFEQSIDVASEDHLSSKHQWFECDDCDVRQVTHDTVTDVEGYLLFYVYRKSHEELVYASI